MKISKFIHSCLLIEKGTDKLLFDPGKFSFIEGKITPQQFQGLTAIILTHQHPDHVETGALKTILQHNPSAVIFTNAETQAVLTSVNLSAELFETGTRNLGSFQVEAFPAPHSAILGSPAPQNTAYLVDKVLLNPGDSFADEVVESVRNPPLLALPVTAPWTTELSVADFVRRIAPQRVLPVHDGYAKDFFLQQLYERFQKHFSEQNIVFEWMDRPGASIEIT